MNSDLDLYKQAYETPYGECFTLPDGDCIGRGCMHDPAARVLREALEAIIIRCEEGDKRTDWLPTIASIARHALNPDLTAEDRTRQ